MTPPRPAATRVSPANRASVLRCISDRVTFTRMDVVRWAGLSLPTVTDVLEALRDGGYVVPVGNGVSRGGRPPSLYQFNPRARLAIGVQIIAPVVAVGLVDLQHNPVAVAQGPFNIDEGEEALWGSIRSGISAALEASGLGLDRLIGIGVGVPGFIDKEAGVWWEFPRAARIKNVPLRATLGQAYGAPVFLENETNVCARAELRCGGLQLKGDVLVLSCYEGLKASVVADGRVLSGHHGNFGSVGHFIVEENGRLCPCGSHGCLEMYVSGYAFRERLGPGLLDRLQLTSDSPWLTHRVFQCAAEGDVSCREVVEEVVPLMAYGFASLMRLTNIDQVVLSGAFAKGGDYLKNLLHEMIAGRLPRISRASMRIYLGAQLGLDVMVVSAAWPAIQSHLGIPAC